MPDNVQNVMKNFLTAEVIFEDIDNERREWGEWCNEINVAAVIFSFSF